MVSSFCSFGGNLRRRRKPAKAWKKADISCRLFHTSYNNRDTGSEGVFDDRIRFAHRIVFHGCEISARDPHPALPRPAN